MRTFVPSKVTCGEYSEQRIGRPEKSLNPAPPQDYLIVSKPSLTMVVKTDLYPDER